MASSPAGERGMVTAELAACLPVLVLVLAIAVSAVSVADVRVRAQDAAREAARAAARGDIGQARRLAAHASSGVSLDISTQGDEVIAVARISVHPMASWLPGLTVSERAVAAVEPSAASP